MVKPPGEVAEGSDPDGLAVAHVNDAQQRRYDRLAARAITFDVDGVQISVAALDDIIASKRAADRPKDRVHLPVLTELQEELRARGGEGAAG